MNEVCFRQLSLPFVSFIHLQFSVSRSLKTIQFKEVSDNQLDHSASRFVDFSALRLLQSFDCQHSSDFSFLCIDLE